MGLLKKVVGGVKNVVNKVVDTTQDSAKLLANAVVPLKNPYQEEDFKTKFGKTGGKVQNITDAISKKVAEDVVVSKLSDVPVDQGDGKNISSEGIMPSKPQVKQDTGIGSTLLGLGLKATLPPPPQSQVASELVASTSQQPSTTVLPQQNMTLAETILGGVLGGITSGLRKPTAQVAASATKAAAEAAFSRGAPPNMGTGNSQPDRDKMPWYKTPLAIGGFVVAGLIILGFIVKKFFGKRR